MAVILKKSRELDLMRKANQIVVMVWEAMHDMAAPGVTTQQLNQVADEIIRKNGAVPSFLGYPHRGVNDFPAAICASINQEIVHGIPSQDRVLRSGDIISIDVGTIFKGYQGDGAITLPVGEVGEEAKKLIQVTRTALRAGIAQAWKGNRTGDISRAIEEYVLSQGMQVVREYTGHGIGRAMHEDPQVPNYYDSRMPTVLLKPGMTLALEPMVNLGTWKTCVLSDGWTVETQDGQLSAHFEHTIAITDGEPEILTQLNGADFI
ncbi:MAG: type I methionyl aminopeptidase [Anaerolineae bacterium]|nr:type I methionyl aminopeptidase [Anaerolineae bacterium]